MRNLLFAFFSVGLFIHLNVLAAPAEIILIRHGEKSGGSELNERGWQRARELVEFFKKDPRVTLWDARRHLRNAT